MKKRVAIVTGATGGIGREFVKLLLSEPLDEIWAIARNPEKLDVLKAEMGEKVVIYSKDLTKKADLDDIARMLDVSKPVIAYLINNAGMAKMEPYREAQTSEIEKTVQVNCSALAVLCSLCIPYMERGSRILNISSASAFQPLPYLTLYAATKVFERSLSRALNLELKPDGVTVTAVCPGWVDTEMLLTEVNGQQIRFPGITTAERVAAKAMKDAKRGKDMSVCTLYVKGEHLLLKLFPQRVTMRTWLRQIKKYGA